jgi:DNA-binding transcriptional regulator YdaS (Cro superfamily)
LEYHWLGQAAAGLRQGPDALAQAVERVTREQVVAAAQKLKLDAIYFLKGKED